MSLHRRRRSRRAMAKVKASGGTIETPKLPTPTGERFVLFKDPAGNRMGLAGIQTVTLPAAGRRLRPAMEQAIDSLRPRAIDSL